MNAPTDEYQEDTFRQQLRLLDAQHANRTLDAADVTDSVHTLRKRRSVVRRRATGGAFAGLVIACAFFFRPIPSGESTEHAIANSNTTVITTNEESASHKNVQAIQKELLQLRYKSDQLAQVIAKLDSVIEQQTEIDRRIADLERQAWEDSIRVKQSESLTIDVAYDFGY